MFGEIPLFGGHCYTFASVGLNRDRDKVFASRDLANAYMYKLCDKYALKIIKIYDDKHVKTYICTDGIKFFISRD